MVRVPGGAVSGIGQLPAFFIDKYEVTNKAFKRFVDAGGYRSARYWPPSMTTHARTVSWEEAVAEFRDTTGRPGPSTWELGTYPEGQDDWPVRGVSWYEATAYAQFAGKSLPTVHHWRLAAAMGIHSAILEWSNFSGKGPARAGEYLGIGPYGTFDMAGNVKEWCANAVRDRRYIMGGAWNEPNYQYQQPDARLAVRSVRQQRAAPGDAARAGRRPGRGLWTGRAADARLPPRETGQRRGVRRVRPAATPTTPAI